ncbi:hemerythrin domain-containing protein [Micromonospora musae]|uniref:hemerythrin domain-containing protein n=1 Tax=Micromonospora musae TaxID=1894970 RepID=UPI0034368A0E
MTHPTPQGLQLARDLLWVHDLIRRDLETVQGLSREVAAGVSGERVRAAIADLQTRGPLFQLKVNCLHFCEFVHHHHSLESAMLFPALRRADPELGPTVDRLESDHRRVAELLGRVESLAGELDGAGVDDDAAVRAELVAALDGLGSHLLEHLDFEESSVLATIRTMPALW